MIHFISMLIVWFCEICGLSAQETPETIFLTGEKITQIKAEGWWYITLIQGDQPGAKLTFNPELKPYFDCRIEGETLYLTFKPNQSDRSLKSCDHKPLTAYVTISSLQYLRLSGACRLKAQNTFTADQAQIKIDGACSIQNLSLQSNSLLYKQSGATRVSDFSASVAQKMQINISGVGRLSDASLRSNTLDIDCSGMSFLSAQINVQNVDATASGMSSISLSGLAVQAHQNTSGLSKINTSNLTRP